MTTGGQLCRLHDLSDRVAIVTGGTRGIGRALAEALLMAGARVVVASRDPETCAETQASLEPLGEILGVPTNVGDVEALRSLVERTVERFGGVDIVINNAANPLTQPLGELTTAAWDKSLAVNLRGPAFLVERALPHLRRSKNAAVLNIVSPVAVLFAPDQAMYAAGKAGLISLTKSMAAAFAPDAIRVNALAPGLVATDMYHRSPPEVRDGAAEAALLRRVAQPDEMVGPALLLVSDAGSFITGQILFADGGMTPR